MPADEVPRFARSSPRCVLAAVLVAATLVAILAGCAGSRRAGGYYLDDGPGDHQAVDLAALAALPDPVPTLEPLHSRANRPYRVLGNDYRPMTQREPFLQRGVASWYGKKFHGRLTSIGERYDMYRMTAAHPTLPIPSFARVTNLENGRSVVVRVNDRGPFLHGRAIDLSYLAAHKLGYVKNGSARVEVELLDPARSTLAFATKPAAAPVVVDAGYVATGLGQAAPSVANRAAVQAMPPAAARPADQGALQPEQPGQPGPPGPPGQPGQPALGQPAAASPEHYLQLGAFNLRDKAEAASARLGRQLDWLQVPIRVAFSGGMHRVQAGPYRLREQAARAGAQVESLTGLKPLLLPR